MRLTNVSEINDTDYKLDNESLTMEHYMIEIDNLRQYLLEKEKELQIREKEAVHFKTLVVKKNDEINKLNDTIKRKNEEIRTHINSIRYKIGSCCVDATKSFSGFLLFPVNIFKLFVEYKRRK